MVIGWQVIKARSYGLVNASRKVFVKKEGMGIELFPLLLFIFLKVFDDLASHRTNKHH